MWNKEKKILFFYLHFVSDIFLLCRSLSSYFIVLPETDPRITGGRARYQIGERVNVNCTSGRSKPAVKLTWFINGVPANQDYLKHFKTPKTGREGLEQTTLGLRFRVQQHHFKNGDMKLKVNVFLVVDSNLYRLIFTFIFCNFLSWLLMKCQQFLFSHIVLGRYRVNLLQK